MKRRDLLKGAAAVAALPVVESVKRLDLGPEDALVLEFPHVASPEQREETRRLLREEFPGRKVFVLDGGAKLKVIRPTDRDIRDEIRAAIREEIIPMLQRNDGGMRARLQTALKSSTGRIV